MVSITHTQLILELEENAKSQKVSSPKTPVLRHSEKHFLLSFSWSDWHQAYLNYCQGEINSFKLRFKQPACHLSLPEVLCAPALRTLLLNKRRKCDCELFLVLML